jgi:hypothetical protein
VSILPHIVGGWLSSTFTMVGLDPTFTISPPYQMVVTEHRYASGGSPITVLYRVGYIILWEGTLIISRFLTRSADCMLIILPQKPTTTNTPHTCPSQPHGGYSLQIGDFRKKDFSPHPRPFRIHTSPLTGTLQPLCSGSTTTSSTAAITHGDNRFPIGR